MFVSQPSGDGQQSSKGLDHANTNSSELQARHTQAEALTQQQQQQVQQLQQQQQQAAQQPPPPTRVPVSSAAATPAAAVPSHSNIAGAAVANATAAQASHQSGIAAGIAAPAAASSSSINSKSSSHHQSQLATSSRSKYKTYILTNGVFEVERRYEIREIIGQGAYGVVCSALDRKRNCFMAVKKIENVFDHRSLAKRTLRELKLVRTFNHENILGLDRVMRPHSSTFNNVYLVSELMETDLACVIRSPQELTDEHVQFFIYQVLRGLKYIHSANVIHRDLKPRNLLVNSNCDLKICDFGLARVDEPANADRYARLHTLHIHNYHRASTTFHRSCAAGLQTVEMMPAVGALSSEPQKLVASLSCFFLAASVSICLELSCRTTLPRGGTARRKVDLICSCKMLLAASLLLLLRGVSEGAHDVT